MDADDYQAGKLVKTIPLSPKEERKYSVKTNRNVKRSSKEAKKNNSSHDQRAASTSRVEADIMAKAQNKTNFGLSAEGDLQRRDLQGQGHDDLRGRGEQRVRRRTGRTSARRC